MQSFYGALANAILILHVGYVLFVVGGLILILAGGVRGWQWVRNPWFRAAHIAAIGYVMFEAWLGIVCPLTTLELWLRELAGQTSYSEDFIAYWLRRLLFFDAPPRVFTVSYSAFDALVLLSWFGVRPRPLFHPTS